MRTTGNPWIDFVRIIPASGIAGDSYAGRRRRRRLRRRSQATKKQHLKVIGWQTLGVLVCSVCLWYWASLLWWLLGYPYSDEWGRIRPLQTHTSFPSPTRVDFCLYEAAVKKQLYSGYSSTKNTESAIFSGFTTKKFPISFRCRRSHVCLRLWKVIASNYFNTDQVLEMVLADGSDLEDEESVEDFGELGWNCSVRLQVGSFLEVQFNLSRHVTGLHC